MNDYLAFGFILFIALVNFLNGWHGVPFVKIGYLIALLIIVIGLTWELFEYLSDITLNTQSFGVYGMDATNDTIFDIIFNILGVTSAFVFKKYRSV